ncbi:LysR family transcriptional regulator [Lacticaseibacillus porcinae]|uniref:LysR family transcriptional regulator n=1 Tax=Lacticaseibacillus porcinae TaxID=1123687 RepID=UPI000F78E77E|nr:LysR family transcriptional regulator [Lacticaseibacillus porcinae]
MQLQDLTVFQKLYQLRSINQTATALGFAQSNISARLKVIESEFGVQLFKRTPQGIVPTPSGNQFAEYADEVCRATQQLRANFETQANKPKILISSLLFDYLVVEKQAYTLEQAEYEMTSSTEMNNLTFCDAAQVISYAPFHVRGYHKHHRDQLSACFMQGVQADPEALPILVNADQQCPFRQRSLKFASRRAQPVQEIDSWSSIMQLVEQGQGVALLPKYLSKAHHFAIAWPTHHYHIPYTIWTKL